MCLSILTRSSNCMRSTASSLSHGVVWAYVHTISSRRTAHRIQPILRHPTGGPAMPILERLAKARNVDTHAILYLWQLGMGVNIVTTSGSPANIDKLASIDRMEPLSRAEVDEITQAGRRIHWRNEKGVSPTADHLNAAEQHSI